MVRRAIVHYTRTHRLINGDTVGRTLGLSYRIFPACPSSPDRCGGSRRLVAEYMRGKRPA